jgi:Zn finger protein HypA/HybF involved in hydrogenase expression
MIVAAASTVTHVTTVRRARCRMIHQPMPYRCYNCQSEMELLAWRCPNCRAQNRMYTGGQIVIAIALALFILFFFGKR